MPVRTPPPSLRRLKDVFADLVDHRVGIIQYVSENPKEPGAPDFFRFVARASDTLAFCPQANFDVSSAASGTREMALAKTIGEAVERYCAAVYERSELPLASAAEAGFPCVGPEEWALFAPHQFGEPGFIFRPWTPETPVRWVEGRDLATGEAVWVPACFVYVPYTFSREEGELPIAQPISTGLACHCSFEEAAAGGLCEVIERDAFTITWQARMARARVRLASLGPENRDLVRRLEAAGYRVDVMDATADSGVPAILASLRGTSPSALPVVFAASAALDPEEAVRKALEELAHTERYMWQIRNTVPEVAFQPGHRNVVDQVSHLRFWMDPARLELAAWVWSSEKEIDFADLPSPATGSPGRDLGVLVERIGATGHRALAVDVTTPDVAAAGLSVLSTLVPGYHPLHMGHLVRALGGRRLWQLPRRLGFPGIDPATGDNPFPHPFP